MIHEIALFPVKSHQTQSFERAFAEVSHLLTRAKGYQGHLLMQGVEEPAQFTLFVQWESLADHIQVFEPSEDHRVFMQGLEEYLAGEPSVQHGRVVSPFGWGGAL